MSAESNPQGPSVRERPGFTRVDSRWSSADAWGALRCRLSRFQLHYRVPPGLYALGSPGEDSPVVVTASYKLTFDLLRKDLAGTDCWILVLETQGINVWCAARGGSFGTEELVARVTRSRLADVVKHRELTLPQLSAAGVKASLVRKHTGFRVRYGPARSADLARYLAAGSVTPQMRTIRFDLLDRLVLVPMEVGKSLKLFLAFAFAALIYAGFGPGGVALEKAWTGFWPLLALGLGSVAAGSVLTPVLLPWIPFRTLTAKGWLLGALATGALLHGAALASGMGSFLLAACWLFFPGAAGYLAFSFIGATTFITAKAARRETRLALPFFAAAAVLTVAALVFSKLRPGGP